MSEARQPGRWKRWWHPANRPATIAGLILWLLILALAYALIEIRSPWTAGMWLRRSEGLPFRIQDYVVTMIWYAAAANLLVCLVLFFTRKFWLQKPVATLPALPPLHPDGRGRWIWPVVMAAVVTAAILGAPRLNHSLWGDEAYSFRRAIHGFYEKNEQGELEFSRVTWMETLWGYRNPNNHIPYSIIARPLAERATRDGWDWGRIETAVRLPAFVAGLAGLLAVAWLLARLGYYRAAAVAPWILALHPWYLRYLVEARGYALVLLLAPLVLILAIQALKRPSWPRWVGFGLSQALLLYAYPGMLYFLAVLNLGLLAALARPSAIRDFGWAPAARWLTACVVSAMVFFQWYAPCIPQLLEYLARDRAQGEMTLRWVQDASALLVSGMTWVPWDAANPLCRTLQQLHSESPWQAAVFLWVIPALLLLGVGRLIKSGGTAGALVAATLVLPVLLSVAVAGLRDMLMYLWYVIYAVPGIAILTALGLDTLAAPFTPARRLLMVGMTVAMIFLVWFAMGTSEQRRILRQHSTEPQRESVAATRPWLDPFDERNAGVITAGFLMTSVTYDPWVEQFETAAELQDLMRAADQTGRPLFVNFGQIGLARVRHPDIMEWIEDPDLFEEVGIFHGLEPFNTRHVYRHRPSPPSGSTEQ